MDLLIRFYQGEKLSLANIRNHYEVSERTVYRDIEALRAILLERHTDWLFFNPQTNHYELQKKIQTDFTLAETISLIKILLHSRALSYQETQQLSNKLLSQLNHDDQKIAKFIVSNELNYYEPLQHGQDMLPLVSAFSDYIFHHQEISFGYVRSDEKVVSRTNRPVSLFFSEMYFYVMFYSKHLNKHIAYRLDRFQPEIKKIGKSRIDKQQELEDASFKKKTHYMLMNSQKTSTITFKYWELPAIPLDVFPNSKVIQEKKHQEDCTIIEITAFEYSAKKWFLGQGNKVEVLKPDTFKAELVTEIKQMYDRYLEAELD